MKKKILVLGIILLLIIMVFMIYNIHKNATALRDKERYNQIIKDVEKEIIAYLKVSFPLCWNEVSETSHSTVVITDETLINIRGMKREKILDIDGKSYCNVRIEATCRGRGEWDLKTSLNCKDYKDVGYSNWDGMQSQK